MAQKYDKSDKKLLARQRAKAWAEANPERYKERQRQWKEKNADKVKAYSRAYVSSHKAEKAFYDKEYNQMNFEKKRIQSKAWHENNREQSRASKKRYSDKNRLMWRLYSFNRRNKMKVVGEKIKLEDISNWDSRECGVCSQYIEDSYHLDHIEPLSKGGAHAVSNIQLTHPICNLKKYNKLAVAGEV